MGNGPQGDPLGLIAGSGDLPRLLARAARRRGQRVFAVAIRGEAEARLAAEVDGLRWLRAGQLGGMVRALQYFGVRQAALAGGVRKRRVLQTGGLDITAWHLLWRIARREDDALLRAIAGVFERGGIRIVASTDILPETLAPVGALGRHRPSGAQQRAIAYGLSVAHAVGALDIGQCVVVHNGAVVAIEAMEGTDACIARAGTLCAGPGAVVVKAAKPQQDMRFDVPTVGPDTIGALQQAGGQVLALEAGRVMILHPQQTAARADAAGIAVYGAVAQAPQSAAGVGTPAWSQ